MTRRIVRAIALIAVLAFFWWTASAATLQSPGWMILVAIATPISLFITIALLRRRDLGEL